MNVTEQMLYLNCFCSWFSQEILLVLAVILHLKSWKPQRGEHNVQPQSEKFMKQKEAWPKKGREALLYLHWACIPPELGSGLAAPRGRCSEMFPLLVLCSVPLRMPGQAPRDQRRLERWSGLHGRFLSGEVLAAGCKHIWLSGCCQTPAVVTLRDILPAVLGT